MKNKIAIVFPGQGSQVVGMGKDLYENFDSFLLHIAISSFIEFSSNKNLFAIFLGT